MVVDDRLAPAMAAKTALHEAGYVLLHANQPVGDYATRRGLEETETNTLTVRLWFPQAEEVRALLTEADRHKDAARAGWEQSARLRSQAVTTLRDTGWTYQDIADALA